MIGGLGWQELLIVLVIVALIFGASRVADLGGALGRGIREFRQEAANPDGESEDEAMEDAASSDEADDESNAASAEKESSG